MHKLYAMSLLVFTFLLGNEANQNTDGVFIQVIRYVGTGVT